MGSRDKGLRFRALVHEPESGRHHLPWPMVCHADGFRVFEVERMDHSISHKQQTASKEILEARLAAQAVESRIHPDVRQPGASVVKGFFQAGERLIALSKVGEDRGDVNL